MERNWYQGKIAQTCFAQGVISLAQAKEIMNEEGIDYDDEELAEILAFVSELISITTCHYERLKKKG